MKKLNIHSRVSVNLICFMKWTLEQEIAFLKAAGVDAISLTTAQLGERPLDAIAAIKKAGLRAVSLGTGGASLVESEAATLESLTRVIDMTHALDCPSAYTVTGPTPSHMSTDEAYDRLAATLAPAVAYAGSKGVRLAIEHNSIATRQHGFVHTLADVAELSRATGVDICLELQNCWYERHLDRLFRENAERFVIVQVSDFSVGEELRFNRRVPGDGVIPLEWMIGRLLDAGYKGYFDLEMLGPHIEAEGYASAAARGVDWLSERLQSWGA